MILQIAKCVQIAS